MSAKGRNNSVSSILSNLFNRNREARRKRKSPVSRRGRHLQMEGLESREMFSVSSLYLSGGLLSVYTDNNATSVTVGQVGSNYRVTEGGSGRYWDFFTSSFGRVDFVGGAGDDRFINNVPTMNTRAWGQGGNDYLEGYNGVDYFVGGDGNDTLVGYGGNDQMWGGNGDDVLRGMVGFDIMYGNAGNDHMDGGSENDQMWGNDGHDTLLGGVGDDQLVGDNGNDHLNGQAGNDRMWGVEGNDVLVAIDGYFNEYVDGGNGADTLWIDHLNYIFGSLGDTAYNASSTGDVVQRVQNFANGADTTLDGDNIADPTDIGTKLRFNNNITAGNTQGANPLFARGSSTYIPPFGIFEIGGGPLSSDINQGALGDCWLLAGLGSVANKSQSVIQQNVVDFNDGTYGVRLGDNFYRVDNELPVASAAGGAVSANLTNAALGAQNSMWVAVVEKAFAHYRSGANTYASVASGTSNEVFNAFRMKNVATQTLSNYSSAASMASSLYSLWTQGYSLAIGSIAVTGGGTHAFTVERFILDSAGAVTNVVLRNPWATDGLNSFSAFSTAAGGVSTTDGVFTVTIAQLFSSGGRVHWGQV
jgi:Calpain family cysteine protease/RTX calcium-binding nonapeptide repeat (4 copies)